MRPALALTAPCAPAHPPHPTALSRHPPAVFSLLKTVQFLASDRWTGPVGVALREALVLGAPPFLRTQRLCPRRAAVWSAALPSRSLTLQSRASSQPLAGRPHADTIASPDASAAARVSPANSVLVQWNAANVCRVQRWKRMGGPGVVLRLPYLNHCSMEDCGRRCVKGSGFVAQLNFCAECRIQCAPPLLCLLAALRNQLSRLFNRSETPGGRADRARGLPPAVFPTCSRRPYCSKSCQTAHWALGHRRQCRKLQVVAMAAHAHAHAVLAAHLLNGDAPGQQPGDPADAAAPAHGATIQAGAGGIHDLLNTAGPFYIHGADEANVSAAAAAAAAAASAATDALAVVNGAPAAPGLQQLRVQINNLVQGAFDMVGAAAAGDNAAALAQEPNAAAVRP